VPDLTTQFAPLFQPAIDNADVAENGFERHQYTKLPDGSPVLTAVPGEQSTLNFWLQISDGSYHYITQAQAFVQDLFLHYATGAAIASNPAEAALGLNTLPAHLTTTDLLFAVHTMPDGLGTSLVNTFGEQAIVDYALHEAPDIVIVGTSPA
jgi:hypothetical protein